MRGIILQMSFNNTCRLPRISLCLLCLLYKLMRKTAGCQQLSCSTILYRRHCELPMEDAMHSKMLAATTDCTQRNTGCPDCALNTVARAPARIHHVNHMLDSLTPQHVRCAGADGRIHIAKDRDEG